MILLVHRQSRDDEACRVKYGDDWEKVRSASSSPPLSPPPHADRPLAPCRLAVLLARAVEDHPLHRASPAQRLLASCSRTCPDPCASLCSAVLNCRTPIPALKTILRMTLSRERPACELRPLPESARDEQGKGASHLRALLLSPAAPPAPYQDLGQSQAGAFTAGRRTGAAGPLTCWGEDGRERVRVAVRTAAGMEGEQRTHPGLDDEPHRDLLGGRERGCEVGRAKGSARERPGRLVTRRGRQKRTVGVVVRAVLEPASLAREVGGIAGQVRDDHEGLRGTRRQCEECARLLLKLGRGLTSYAFYSSALPALKCLVFRPRATLAGRSTCREECTPWGVRRAESVGEGGRSGGKAEGRRTRADGRFGLARDGVGARRRRVV